MTFALACPDCEGITHEFQRLAIAKPEMRSEYECSTCLRDMQAMEPVAFGPGFDQAVFIAALLPPGSDKINRLSALFARALVFGLWPNAEALYIVVTREMGPFRWEYVAIPVLHEDYTWPDYVGLCPPASAIVSKGACCSGAVR